MVRNPSVSRLSVVFSVPVRGIVPNEGLQPYTPQKLAGRTIEPAVCDPVAIGTIPSAIPTADPLDEVPGPFVTSHGFCVLSSACTANSAVTVFPTITAPSRLRGDTARR